MSVVLSANSYGKSAIRVVKVSRTASRHEISDVSVSIQFEGDFESVHRLGDNAAVLPTDTMKNTVYALAGKNLSAEVEIFGIALTAHFLTDAKSVKLVRVELAESPWERMTVKGIPHTHAFSRGSGEKRTVRVARTRAGKSVESGIEDLLVIKTAGSAFEGYIKDRYTTLPETVDRLLATAMNASWRYWEADVEFAHCRERVRQTLLETFATHESRSVQHTAFAMGEAVLERVREVEEIRLSLPNKHHLLVDLTPFGLENRNEIFVPTDDPHGQIEVSVRRTEAVR